MKYKFKIKGLDCANCAAELERAIQKIDEVKEEPDCTIKEV